METRIPLVPAPRLGAVCLLLLALGACGTASTPGLPAGPLPIHYAFFFDFESDAEGWSFDDMGGPYDAAYRHSDARVLLDGSDLGLPEAVPVPNAWAWRDLALPPDVTTLTYMTSAHTIDPSDSALRVRLVDENGGAHVLQAWEVLLGPPGGLNFVERSADISPFAGQTVRIYFEQDDDGEGSNEQRWIDDIGIY